ncbi:hypothetical protein W02_11510 [Nitrospira sp. KM1]|uniref:hypothetical protein n=1 Tax=Nitrospira sp. KM1 TaxID=1936990 RepID=UPI0013A7A1B1|nr:hypothetical protein [Nitrospira sp. KM1]BCA54011.1 hypothetical protein W02_11510 [Nitrospira sp. KM1]
MSHRHAPLWFPAMLPLVACAILLGMVDTAPARTIGARAPVTESGNEVQLSQLSQDDQAQVAVAFDATLANAN